MNTANAMHIDMAEALRDDMLKAFAIPPSSSYFGVPSFCPSLSPSANDESVAKGCESLKCLSLRMLSEAEEK